MRSDATVPFEQVIAAHLAEERTRIAAIYQGEPLPERDLVRCQAVSAEQFRLPEYFRGAAEATVATASGK
jgi:hypothetical protein